MNLLKKLTKNPEPEEFQDDGYDNGYYDFPENDTLVTDDSAIETVAPVEEPVEDQAEMREPQPMPKKPLEPAKPAVKYYSPTDLSDRQKAVAKLAEGYIVMLLDIDQLEKDVFLRFFDYVMGAVQALDGDIRKINKSTLALIPYGANVDDIDEDDIAETEEQADEE